MISAFGGSNVQIAGPTAAFATIVAGIVASEGFEGLIVATILAGIILIIMGVCRFGSLIKFIPYTITTGFTSGIALTIVIGELKDFFGLTYPDGLSPIETMEKLNAVVFNINTVNLDALIVGLVSLVVLILCQKYLNYLSLFEKRLLISEESSHPSFSPWICPFANAEYNCIVASFFS